MNSETLKVIPDTNQLVSAIGWKGSVPYRVLQRAIERPDIQLHTTRLILKELEEVFQTKRLYDRYPGYKYFVENVLSDFIILKDIGDIEKEESLTIKIEDEELIPKSNDREIYRTAVYHGLDVLISGDHHFLNSGAKEIKIVSARDFLENY